MDDLAIRRDRNMPVPRMQDPEKAEKPESAAAVRGVRETADAGISKGLQVLLNRLNLEAERTQAGQRLLLAGESALAEVEAALQRVAGGGGDPSSLAREIDRILANANVGGSALFRAGESGEGADQINLALLEGLAALAGSQRPEGVSEGSAGAGFPDWFIQGLRQCLTDPARALAALNIPENASPEQLLAAVTGRELGSNDAAALLATLYVGAIAGGVSAGNMDIDAALEGLRQLLDQVAQGLSPDEALQKLSGGLFSGFEDLEDQFVSGQAPNLMLYLESLLGGQGDLLDGELGMLSGLLSLEGLDSELTMGLLDVLQSSEASAAQVGDLLSENVSVQQFGGFTVSGRDLSGVSFDSRTGVLVVGGDAAVTIQGTARDGESILLTGSAAVTLRDVDTAGVTVDSPGARLLTAGENVLDHLVLIKGSGLDLSGTGLLDLGSLRGEGSNRLLLSGGAVLVNGGKGSIEGQVDVTLLGAASLAAQQPSAAAWTASDLAGHRLEPFDVVWQTLLPGFQNVTSLAVDGMAARMVLVSNENVSDMARLWLRKGTDSSHGYPVHTVAFMGRDENGRVLTRYAYLRWDDRRGAFREVVMYPNPFTVVGGAEGEDWLYEEHTQTLRILSPLVTAIAGGQGVTAEEDPFSGRLAVDSQLGELELTLGGVSCRVTGGRAFQLGRDNQVTLLLRDGTENSFVSGAGCAGISLGDGTELIVDRGPEEGGAPGRLSATGGDGGAGLGRDSGGSWDRVSSITIRGGVIEARGGGAGAGIGAGKHGFFGDVTITGGTVTATGGGGGGAGIGGALGAPVGNITIRGGRVTALATYHAAGIGAGIEGESGDILITGTARILRCQGGDPGADIGACLFGRCGTVKVEGGADIGAAQMKGGRQEGISLSAGSQKLTLPVFCLSSEALRLKDLPAETAEDQRRIRSAASAALQRVEKIRSAYSDLNGRMEESLSALRSAHQAASLIRDSREARDVLRVAKRSMMADPAELLKAHSERVAENVLKLLK